MSGERRFDPESHSYWLDGQRVPSVTQVLHATGFLPDYSKLDPFYRERGSAAHAAIHLDILGQLDDDSLDEHVGPYVDRFRLWAASVNFRPVFVEGALFCPVYGYAGTPDTLAYVNDRLTLPDWKTGQFEPGHVVQVAGGYLPLLETAAREDRLPVSLEELHDARVCIVPLDKAEPVPVWVAPDEIPNQRDIFRSALACFNWRDRHMGGVR